MNKLDNQPLDDSESESENEFNFESVEVNAGTVVAIAGDDFAIIAADKTFISCGNKLMIAKDNKHRLFQMTRTSVLGCSGCWCDTVALAEHIEAQRQMYEYRHRREMPLNALAQQLSVILYARRCYPHIVLNILAGLDQYGKGAVYTYDAIGDFERCTHYATGVSGDKLMPLLDNWIGTQDSSPMTKQRAINIVGDCFKMSGICEPLLMNIITKAGIEQRSMAMQKD